MLMSDFPEKGVTKMYGHRQWGGGGVCVEFPEKKRYETVEWPLTFATETVIDENV